MGRISLVINWDKWHFALIGKSARNFQDVMVWLPQENTFIKLGGENTPKIIKSLRYQSHTWNCILFRLEIV